MGLMAEAWRAYEHRVIPIAATRVQRQEMRRAFYAGAQALLTGLLSRFTEDREPTEQDMRLMAEVERELQQFVGDVRNGRA